MAEKGRGTDAADAVRSAVDRTYQATVGQADVTRERAQEIVDELAQAAGKVRATLADLRVVTREDLRPLQEEIAALHRRITALEARQADDRAAATGKPRAARAATKQRSTTSKGKERA